MSARFAAREDSSPDSARLRNDLGAHHVVRKYRLTIHREGADGFGFSMEEAFTGGGRTLATAIVRVSRTQASRVLDAVVRAVRASGHPASVLAFDASTQIDLDEASGVRLAVTLFATLPISKSDRIRGMVAGVNAMSIEEAYYWYSKCAGRDGSRCRRALRTLLSDD